MTPADLDEIMEIERLSFLSPWEKTLFVQELKNPRTILRVVREKARVTGYLALYQVLDEIHLLSIAVHPDFRRKGTATGLLLETLSDCRRQGGKTLYLEVRENNHGAIAFYRRLSLVVAGVRPRYYQDTGENALLLAGEIENILKVLPP
ncbi:MAG: ribosomal protein S18-alanine N-acetyltransferase [Proteobacteria bacterium]|nr:ribosomal protein S18-alanine N-acetyltransferase [Pseudomonadota bacterium]